jgi:hypothetical protein
VVKRLLATCIVPRARWIRRRTTVAFRHDESGSSFGFGGYRSSRRPKAVV